MKKMMILAALAAAMMTILSCDRYEDGRPSKDVRNEFARMYPDAFDVEWEWEGKYWDVSFETGSRPNGIEHEAWYDTDGSWIMTKTEVLLSSVPQKIMNYLALDMTYATASFADNDADYCQTPTSEFYRFDMLMNGREVEVDVNLDGKVSPAGRF